MRLKGRVAVITGSGRGIGKATAFRMAQEGAEIVLTDVNETNINRAKEEIQAKFGVRCLALKMDVANETEVRRQIDEAYKFFGRIDILVNNAGVSVVGNLEEHTWDEWLRVLNINLGGVVHSSKAVLPYMKQQKYGKIISLSSTAAEVGGIATAPSYGASKAAIICFTKSIAKYAAPYNINANAVAPGFVATDMTVDLNQDPKAVPLGRRGEPEDIADVITFLASDDARYITGSTIDVNGGMYMN